METLTIIGVIAAVAAIAGGISFVLHSYSSETYDYPPFNLVTIGISFVCGLLIAVGVYLWLGAGFTANTLVVLGCGILVYVGLLVFVALHSNILIAIWTVTILSALSAVVVPALLIVRFIEDRRNNRPICVVGGVSVWPLPGSLPAQAWTIGGRFDAIGRPCDRISARASVFRTATARHNQVEELDRREPFLILPFRPREMFSAFACCYLAQEPGATKWCRPRDSRMHPLP